MMVAMTDVRSDITVFKSEISSINFKVIIIEAAILNNTSMLTNILESVNGVNHRKRSGHSSSSETDKDGVNGCSMDTGSDPPISPLKQKPKVDNTARSSLVRRLPPSNRTPK